MQNLSLTYMRPSLAPILNGINGTFWKFPEIYQKYKKITNCHNKFKKIFPLLVTLIIPNKKTNLKELEDLESVDLEKAFPYVIVWLKR